MRAFTTFVASIAVCSGSPASGQDYRDVVVFGDSLSDNGNAFELSGFPPPPYWEGRFSNGRIWVEQLANQLGLDPDAISDHAVGAVLAGDVLNAQVLPYVAALGGQVDDAALYTIWAGANDVFVLLATPGADPAVVIGAAIQDLSDAIDALLAAGARHVLVVNLPDLAATPQLLATRDPAVIAAARAATLAFNDALGQAVLALELLHGVDVRELDAFSLHRSILASPRNFGFKEVAAPAFDGLHVARSPDEFLYWDEVHPTTAAHHTIVVAAVAALGRVFGDLDGSGRVDARDLLILGRSLGRTVGPCRADLDADGVVDVDDLRILQRAWVRARSSRPAKGGLGPVRHGAPGACAPAGKRLTKRGS